MTGHEDITLEFAGRTIRLSPQERDEWARRAVKVFQGMEYSLGAFARVLTGNPAVRLEMTPGSPRTDGRTIYYRPPLYLGDPTPHRTSQCDRRDADGHLICVACLVRESVVQIITHEVAHIVGGSFSEASEAVKKNAIRTAVGTAQDPIASRVLHNKLTLVKWNDDIQAMMRKLSPFLGGILLCLEDARIDLKMFKARLGTEKMFRSMTKRVFKEGYADLDGSVALWRDKPLNAQMLIGCYCVAERYDYTGWLHPKVEQDLSDPVLQDILARVDRSGGVHDVAALSIETLIRLWTLGYCDPPVEMPPPPPFEPPPPQQEEQDENESQPEEGDESGQGESSEPGAEDQDPGGDSSGTEDSPGQDSEGSESDSDRSGESPGSDDGMEQRGSEEGSPQEASDEPEDEGVSDQPGSARSSKPDGSGLGGSGEEGEGDPGDVPSDPSDSTEDSTGSGESGDSGDNESTESGHDSTGSGSASDSDTGRETDNTGSEPDPGSGRDSEPNESGSQHAESDTDPSAEQAGDEGASGGGTDDSPSDTEGPGDGSADGTGGPSGGSPSEHSDGAEGAPGDQGSDGTPDLSPREESDTAGSRAGDESPAEAESEADNNQAPPLAGEDGGDEDGGDPARDIPSTDAPDLAPGGAGSARPPERRTHEDQPQPLPDNGSAEAVAELIQDFTGHNHDDDEELHFGMSDSADTDAAMDKAITQNKNFDLPTGKVLDVEVFEWPKDDKRCYAWLSNYEPQNHTVRIGDKDWKGNDAWDIIRTPENILQPALFDMRRVFSDNRRGRREPNLKSGRVNGRVLGRRAWSGDDRLFKKMDRPKSKSYAVVIGLDISGSTDGAELLVEKQAVFAQAELLHRMGIPFEIWAHSAKKAPGLCWIMQMYRVKAYNEPWSQKTQEGVTWLHSSHYNLDGHTVEFYRKRLMSSQATTKILLYFTDGAMPAANKEDEVHVLRQEVKNYKRLGLTMLGVGIGTDSPKRWGMDTIRINNKRDIGLVVKHLEGILTMTNR
jgi:hypothetical protein